MTDCVEIAITSDGSEQLWSCCAWNVRTGTQLMPYRHGGAPAVKTLQVVSNRYIVAGHQAKPLLHIWPINKQDPSNVKYLLAGSPQAVAVSPDGNYCIVAHEDSFNVYMLVNGINVAAVSHHFGKITALKFTDDGSHFVSAAQDCRVVVWSLAKTVLQKDNKLLYEFADFTLPVSDIYVGKGGMKALLAVASLDRSCKIYDLASGKMVLNLVFPVALSVVTMNGLETELYVGNKQGSIFICNLQSTPRSKEIHLPQSLLVPNTLKGHQKAVTCLSMSMDNETLLSGGEDAVVIVWHVKTRTQLKVIPHKGPITNAFFLITPKLMFDQSVTVNVPFPAFHKKPITRGSREAVSMELTTTKHSLRERTDTAPVVINRLSGQATKDNEISEVQRLEKVVHKLKTINRDLYEQSIRFMMSDVNGHSKGATKQVAEG
ncbi:WD repeat-containing protein 18 [Anopheles ziemanni]|uniref:WD repeat-containing protein 18 n=1 Tax=Anopheles coustani TaxID=139045 RepID=UPI00265A2C63|nr:WD repeat-containing protein 18 [Anopheles coustani]XP_058170587.1 WD repeat-containing protein 18 [Anopheles ziemanni]